MPLCALPDHLKEKKHNDWIWPLSYIPRGANAFGPRCGKGNKGYLPWPPKLVEGKGVARWESDGATSIIEIPSLANIEIKAKDVYGREFTYIERNVGRPDCGKIGLVTLSWTEGMNIEGQYHPSALQKFSNEGWMRLDPDYYAWWKVLERREPKKDDIVMFHRRGFRVDSLDQFYNFSLGFFGLRWE